jgi:hypothetical protein
VVSARQGGPGANWTTNLRRSPIIPTERSLVDSANPIRSRAVSIRAQRSFQCRALLRPVARTTCIVIIWNRLPLVLQDLALPLHGFTTADCLILALPLWVNGYRKTSRPPSVADDLSSGASIFPGR